MGAAGEDPEEEGEQRRRTLRGLPVVDVEAKTARPPSDPAAPAVEIPPSSKPPGRAFLQSRPRRVTLNLSGPPLTLPKEDPRSTLPWDAPRSLEARADSGPPSSPRPALPPAGLGGEEEALDSWMPETLPGEGGDAIGLVERPRRPSQPMDLSQEMVELFELGDFSGALRAAELLLGRSPDHADGKRYASRARDSLERLHAMRFGGTTRVPKVVVAHADVRWLGLDHRAGFLLSRITGLDDVEGLIDVSGMSRLEVLKTLVELLEAGAIEFSS